MKSWINNLKLNKFFTKNSVNEDINGPKVGSDSKDNSESVCCRICNSKEDNNQLLYNPCSCVGQSSFIHRKCLDVWFQKARYDVLCCGCKARYIRIKYRHDSSFRCWLREEPKIRRHVMISAVVFPSLFLLVIFGFVKAILSESGQIFKVLFVPTMIFGILTLWKFVGSLALILRDYINWKNSRLNTKCDKNPQKESNKKD